MSASLPTQPPYDRRKTHQKARREQRHGSDGFKHLHAIHRTVRSQMYDYFLKQKKKKKKEIAQIVAKKVCAIGFAPTQETGGTDSSAPS